MRDDEARQARRDLLDDPDAVIRAAFMRRLVPVEFRPHEPGAFGSPPPGVKDGDAAWVLEFPTRLKDELAQTALVVLADGRILPVNLSILRIRKDFLP